jgi:hypothetical protein
MSTVSQKADMLIEFVHHDKKFAESKEFYPIISKEEAKDQFHEQINHIC